MAFTTPQRCFAYCIGSQDEFDFDARLFHTCCLLFTALLALNVIAYSLLGKSSYEIATFTVGVIGNPVYYYLSRFRHQLNLALWGFTLQFLLLTDIYWVINSDTRLSSSYFQLMLIGILIFSAPRPKLLILLVLGNELALCLLDIFLPESSLGEHTSFDKTFRGYLAFIVCALFMFLMVTRFKQITTEQRKTIERYYQTLIIKNQEIKTANRAKDLFFASISHDIRTPLNAIIGFSKRLLNKIPDKLEARELAALESIHRSGQNMMVLLNDLLDFSKLDAGKMQISINNFDVAELIRELQLDVGAQMEAKQIQMHIEAPQAAVTMSSDRQRLMQILENLVSNATKYGGGKDFTLTWSLDEERDTIVFDVSDQGPGIDTEHQAVLFTAYASSHYHFNDAEHSTGLGLSIVAKLAELLGGRVSYKKLEGGSLFRVELPLRLAVGE